MDKHLIKRCCKDEKGIFVYLSADGEVQWRGDNKTGNYIDANTRNIKEEIRIALQHEDQNPSGVFKCKYCKKYHELQYTESSIGKKDFSLLPRKLRKMNKKEVDKTLAEYLRIEGYGNKHSEKNYGVSEQPDWYQNINWANTEKETLWEDFIKPSKLRIKQGKAILYTILDF